MWFFSIMQTLITNNIQVTIKIFLFASLKYNPHQLRRAGSTALFVKMLHSLFIYPMEHESALSEQVSKVFCPMNE